MNWLNPLGLLALLSIPIIIYIHMLQRKSKKRRVSTLFLLNSEKIEKKAGSRLEKLRNSKLLWLNLLVAVLMTLLLLQLRKVQEQKVLRVVVVVDASVSMSAFWEKGSKDLANELTKLAGKTKYIDIKIISSSIDEASIYSGALVGEASAALASFSPSRSGHELGPALRRASSLLDDKGMLILCSDRPHDLSEDVMQYLIGEAIANIGFTGFQAQANGKWQAVIKNHGPQAAQVKWAVGIPGNEKLVEQSVSLQAGELRQLRGEFPPTNDKMILSLPEDRFAPDNRLYAVRPLSKKMNLEIKGFDDKNELQLLGILNRFDRVSFNDTPADFAIAQLRKLDDLGTQAGFYFLPGPYEWGEENLTAFNSPMIEGLNWQGIPFALAPKSAIPQGFYPLIKSGKNDLLLMRETALGPQFICCFNLNDPAIIKSPAMIVLMYRAIQKAREFHLAYNRKNFESDNEFYDYSLAGKKLKVSGVKKSGVGLFRTAEKSGFFSILIEDGEKQKLMMEGGVFYADAAEGNFLMSESRNDIDLEKAEIVTIWQERSFLQSFWILLLILILIYGWYVFDKRQGMIQKVGQR